MSVKVLIVTHDDVGNALISAVRKTLGNLPLATTVIPVGYEVCPDALKSQLQAWVNQMARQEDVLILTDLFGSTPCNIANKLKEDSHIRIVSGLNLPMLIRVMNYPNLSLGDLVNKAVTGGRDGVIDCC